MSFKDFDDLAKALRSPLPAARDLYAAWEQRQPVAASRRSRSKEAASEAGQQIEWMQDDPRLISLFTRGALRREEFLLVCDCAEEVARLQDLPEDKDRIELVRVRMDHAAALARLGRTRAARQELEPCLARDFPLRLGPRLKADILVQLGNILRQESLYAATLVAQQYAAGEALRFYEWALEVDPERLDALSLAAAVGFTSTVGEPPDDATPDEKSAHALARTQARERARLTLARARDEEDAGEPTFQTMMNRAVAQIVLGDPDAAAASYGALAGLPGAGVPELAGARYWSQFFAAALKLESDYFKKAFPPLVLLVFSGHVPDQPGDPPRFPPEAVPAVRTFLREELGKMHAMTGMCSAAAGADLLFFEALRERGGTVHLVLPWSQEEFRRATVQRYERPGQTPVWEPLFERAVREAATVRELGQLHSPTSQVSDGFQMEVTAGLALHAARVSRLDLQPVAFWDGRPGRSPAGVAAFVDFWRERLGREPVVLHPPPVEVVGSAQDRAEGSGRRARGDASRCEFGTLRQEVKSMLFADIVGYSKLREAAIPRFIDLFLDRVSRRIAESPHAPRHINTWGDAIYAVFDYARDAGCFALELTDLIQESRDEWLKAGLYWEETLPDGTKKKHPLNLRVGLHTGPVFMHYNPVVRQLGFTGVHVSRAARIEPVATPGEVFASEEFAALSETDADVRRRAAAGGGPEAGRKEAGFVCEYAGSMPLAKGYPGRHRIYRVLPERVFDLDSLARAIHEDYCAAARARGEEPPGPGGALRPWEELPADLRQANLAQAADVPRKLRALGYELAPGYGLRPADIKISKETLEGMAVREHDRWMQERQRQGWTYAPVRDNARKHHPLIVPWADLNEVEREKDRAAVLNVPRLIEKAGFRVRKLGGAA